MNGLDIGPAASGGWIPTSMSVCSRVKPMLPVTSLGFVPARDGCDQASSKGIWWMPWHQEAMKDVARCDKPRGAVSKL